MDILKFMDEFVKELQKIGKKNISHLECSAETYNVLHDMSHPHIMVKSFVHIPPNLSGIGGLTLFTHKGLPENTVLFIDKEGVEVGRIENVKP